MEREGEEDVWMQEYMCQGPSLLSSMKEINLDVGEDANGGGQLVCVVPERRVGIVEVHGFNLVHGQLRKVGSKLHQELQLREKEKMERLRG